MPPAAGAWWRQLYLVGDGMPWLCREMSINSGVHIIASSGFYTQEYIPEFAKEASMEALAEFLINELTVGMEDTGIKAGLLKTGCGYPIIEGLEKKCVTAVARAARVTGAAITTHSPAAGRFETPGGNLGYQYLEII